MHECDKLDIINDIKKTLYGNGQKGLLERVISLQVQIKIVMLGIMALIGMMIKMMFFGG